MFQQQGPEAWPLVAEGLSKITARVGPANWTPEAVKERIQDGRAGLFTCPDGFVVLEECEESISERKYLNVWLAWFKPGRARPLRKPFIAWLDDMTRSRNCEWWEFSSPRKGWAGIEPDCELHMQIWRRYL